MIKAVKLFLDNIITEMNKNGVQPAKGSPETAINKDWMTEGLLQIIHEKYSLFDQVIRNSANLLIKNNI